jgi:hypothetical protein
VGRFFQPYVGRNYATGLANGHKLLLIGESHYNEADCEPCGPEATCEVVISQISGTPIPFFDYMFRSSCGHGRSFTRDEFWQSVAFANFIQQPMETPTHRPTADNWEAGIAPFWETIAELKPDLVFMFTSAWSHWLPSLAPDGDPARTGPVGDDDTWLWRYGLADHDVLIARFYHRSARPNPSVSVWRAWADYCWNALEDQNG